MSESLLTHQLQTLRLPNPVPKSPNNLHSLTYTWQKMAKIPPVRNVDGLRVTFSIIDAECTCIYDHWNPSRGRRHSLAFHVIN